MAEDIHNPLHNPDAQPVSHNGNFQPPREEQSAPDPELEDFLSDYFDTPRDEAEPAAEPEPPEPARAERPPSTPPVETPRLSEAPPQERAPAEPPAPVAEAPAQEDLQRQVLQRLNEQLERMAQPPEPEAPQPPTITPQQLIDQMAPRVQRYIDAGWLTEDHAILYPRETALQVYMWDQIQQGGAQLRETQQFTQAEQQRRSVEEANRTLDTAMDAVAARGEVFGALADKEVRSGFREFLINEVNPRLSQVTPDFLARQFYAFNHQLIYDTINTQRESANGQRGAPSAAQLAAQEGSGARAAPHAPQLPEFADLLEGHPAARWYE